MTKRKLLKNGTRNRMTICTNTPAIFCSSIQKLYTFFRDLNNKISFINCKQLATVYNHSMSYYFYFVKGLTNGPTVQSCGILGDGNNSLATQKSRNSINKLKDMNEYKKNCNNDTYMLSNLFIIYYKRLIMVIASYYL